MSVTAARRLELNRRALDRANEIRLARAELRQKLASGEVFAGSVLLEQPPEACTWEVGDLIRSQRNWGRATCRKLLARLMIPANKPVAGLTERQRRVLAEQLAHGRVA